MRIRRSVKHLICVGTATLDLLTMSLQACVGSGYQTMDQGAEVLQLGPVLPRLARAPHMRDVLDMNETLARDHVSYGAHGPYSGYWVVRLYRSLPIEVSLRRWRPTRTMCFPYANTSRGHATSL